MANGEDKIYQPGEGMPVAPDVEAIQSAFPDLKIGDRISYEAIEKLIHCLWNIPRFKSVTDVWRKRELEKGIVLKVEPGKCFYVADSENIFGSYYDAFSQAQRKLKKQWLHTATIKPKTETEKQIKDLHLGNLAKGQWHMRKIKMDRLPNTQNKQPIQIGPPSKEQIAG